MEREINNRKAAIIGCGFVGSASAFCLMQSGLFSELELLDANRDPHRQTDHDTDDRSDKIGKHRVIYTSRKI